MDTDNSKNNNNINKYIDAVTMIIIAIYVVFVALNAWK